MCLVERPIQDWFPFRMRQYVLLCLTALQHCVQHPLVRKKFKWKCYRLYQIYFMNVSSGHEKLNWKIIRAYTHSQKIVTLWKSTVGFVVMFNRNVNAFSWMSFQLIYPKSKWSEQFFSRLIQFLQTIFFLSLSRIEIVARNTEPRVFIRNLNNIWYQVILFCESIAKRNLQLNLIACSVTKCSGKHAFFNLYVSNCAHPADDS